MAWMVGGQVLAQAIHVAARLALAHWLAPRDFGLAATAVLTISFAQLLVDLGLGPALVQRAALAERHRSTVWWASVGIAVILFAAFLLGAPLLGRFFGSSEVVPVIRILALMLLLAVPEAVYAPLAVRTMSFRHLGLRRLGAFAAGSTVGIALAIAGFGVWALVAEQLVRSLASSVLLFLASRWRPTLQFSAAAFGELWPFSRSIVASRLVNFLSRNLDKLVIAKAFGATAIGHYALAYQAILLPLHYLARPLAAVGFPAFAEIQDDLPRCRHAYLSSLRLALFVCAPVAALAGTLAPAVIPALLGPAWTPAVGPLRILSLVAIVQVAMTLSPAVFEGLGRPDFGLRWMLIGLVVNAAGITAGLRWGITGVAAGYLAAVVVGAPIHFRFVLRLLELPPGRLLSIMGRVLICLLPFAIGVLTRLSAPLSAALGLTGYALASRLLVPEAWRLLVRSGKLLVAR